MNYYITETYKMKREIINFSKKFSTLQAAGEWIEYDTKARGWYLQNGISIFFGDDLKK